VSFPELSDRPVLAIPNGYDARDVEAPPPRQGLPRVFDEVLEPDRRPVGAA
jgi:hypothetical protein